MNVDVDVFEVSRLENFREEGKNSCLINVMSCYVVYVWHIYIYILMKEFFEFSGERERMKKKKEFYVGICWVYRNYFFLLLFFLFVFVVIVVYDYDYGIYPQRCLGIWV